MTDRERLEAEVNAAPWSVLLPLADLEEEQGNAERAWGYRTLAKWRVWPLRTARGWEWWAPSELRNYGCSLPRPLLHRLKARYAAAKAGLVFAAPSALIALQVAADMIGETVRQDELFTKEP